MKIDLKQEMKFYLEVAQAIFVPRSVCVGIEEECGDKSGIGLIALVYIFTRDTSWIIRNLPREKAATQAARVQVRASVRARIPA